MTTESIKEQIQGKWKELQTGVTYSFAKNQQIYPYQSFFSITYTQNDSFYFSDDKEYVEIVAISKKVMVWKKNGLYFLFEKLS
ncbi:hypothetical protein ACKGJY_15120 [Hyunsoonleella sp. 2307UL5-6]|uniref:hypothetical protein n=1 Tax=Hyunsoonleella sp. 2307UL5-6 TaxID=3384768 RepID=UPI0039BD390B